MASLQEIKSRLGSISTTKKITKAMQLVATAKLRRAKSNLEGIQEYYTSVYDTFQDLLGQIKDFSALVPANPKESTLYIAITSDLGLCGSYNSNILKMLKEQVKSGDQVIMVGNKGVSSYKVKGKKTYMEFQSVGDNPDYNIASNIGKEAIALYMTGEVKAIKILHTKFINSVTFEAETTQILPVVKKQEEHKEKQHAVTEFEPDAETVVKNAIPLYVSAVTFGSMVESKVSEMSSRRTAMENATDNADELIEKLDLEYNRARQASITQEITEIVAGSDN